MRSARPEPEPTACSGTCLSCMPLTWPGLDLGSARVDARRPIKAAGCLIAVPRRYSAR